MRIAVVGAGIAGLAAAVRGGRIHRRRNRRLRAAREHSPGNRTRGQPGAQRDASTRSTRIGRPGDRAGLRAPDLGNGTLRREDHHPVPAAIRAGLRISDGRDPPRIGDRHSPQRRGRGRSRPAVRTRSDRHRAAIRRGEDRFRRRQRRMRGRGRRLRRDAFEDQGSNCSGAARRCRPGRASLSESPDRAPTRVDEGHIHHQVGCRQLLRRLRHRSRRGALVRRLQHRRPGPNLGASRDLTADYPLPVVRRFTTGWDRPVPRVIDGTVASAPAPANISRRQGP